MGAGVLESPLRTVGIRETIPTLNPQAAVWGHERIMVYGKMISEYLVPDVYANEPIEACV